MYLLLPITCTRVLSHCINRGKQKNPYFLYHDFDEARGNKEGGHLRTNRPKKTQKPHILQSFTRKEKPHIAKQIERNTKKKRKERKNSLRKETTKMKPLQKIR